MRDADTRSTCYSSFSMRILLVVTIKKRIPHIGSILNCFYCRCLRLSFSRGIRGLGRRLHAKEDLTLQAFRGTDPDRILQHCERPG